MFNPFTEVAEGDAADAELVEQAKNGDRAALEKLVLRHQAWIYNIAVRMVFQPHDAEEVTQEVLVKVITKLSTFKGESKFRTWLYRIAANHVLNMKRRSAETQNDDVRRLRRRHRRHARSRLARSEKRARRAAAPGRRSQERLHDGHAALPGPQAAADLHARRDPRRQRHGRRRGPGDDRRQLPPVPGPRPPRPAQLHEQPVRPGEQEQPLPLPEEDPGLHRGRATSIPTISCSFRSMSSASGMSLPKRSAKSRMSSSDSTRPFTAITRFSSPRTRSIGSGACSKSEDVRGALHLN